MLTCRYVLINVKCEKPISTVRLLLLYYECGREKGSEKMQQIIMRQLKRRVRSYQGRKVGIEGSEREGNSVGEREDEGGGGRVRERDK